MSFAVALLFPLPVTTDLNYTFIITVTMTPPDNFLSNILDDMHCTLPTDGADVECDVAPKELPDGHVLHGYRVLRTLGAGGFGVTYLAEEQTLERRVVLKENFPDALCHRQSGTLDVVLIAPEGQETFDWAHNNFLREARLLASLRHPNIAKVYSFFNAHRTAYYVTEFIEGKSLADVANDYRNHNRDISQEAMVGMMVRMLDALDYLHKREVLHRDIKPDNILINMKGLPVLIDFGAAREEYGDADPGVVESLGFSPPEQGKDGGNMGAWTDLYAFGATLYYIMTCTCLPDGRQRELYDMADPLATNERLRAVYDERLLKSIDKAARPAIEERYHNAGEWIADLRDL